MDVSLTNELERFVQEKVNSGRYNSASEVVQEALRLMVDRDQIREIRLQEMRKKIAEGLQSLDRGQGLDGESVFEELEAELDDLDRRQKAG